MHSYFQSRAVFMSLWPVSPVSFSTFAISFQFYCSLLCPAHSYLCTPTLDYLAYRAYANAYLRNGVGASTRYYVWRDAKTFSQKRKKFIRAIKNALRDSLSAWEGCRREYRKITSRIEASLIELLSFSSASHFRCLVQF